jgi:hypothetical protein
VTLAVFLMAGNHGWIVKLSHPTSSDFVSFYAAGVVANGGAPSLVYDRAAHYAAEQQATEPGIPYNFFYYPPVYLLLCAPLATLPYLVAFTLFQILCLLPCMVLARGIVGNVPYWLLLAFPSVFWAIGTGQNALLTAALLATATMAIDRRPSLAGALLGVLCYKPHFGLILPFALAAGRHWRALAAAAISVAALTGTSLLIFGLHTWTAFFAVAQGADAVYATAGSIDMHGLTSPFGAVLALHGPFALALGLQGIATLCAIIIVAWVWRRRQPLAVRAAILLAAIPVAVPIVMFYDLTITGLALAWLMRAGWEQGFPPWQRTGLAIAFLLPLWSGNTQSQLLFAPVTATLGFMLAVRQATITVPRPPELLAP